MQKRKERMHQEKSKTSVVAVFAFSIQPELPKYVTAHRPPMSQNLPPDPCMALPLLKMPDRSIGDRANAMHFSAAIIHRQIGVQMPAMPRQEGRRRSQNTKAQLTTGKNNLSKK